MSNDRAAVDCDLSRASPRESQRVAGAGPTGIAFPLLIALAALGAASMNLVLPSLPALQQVFHIDYHLAQSALTSFPTGALPQLGVGQLADAYRRRPILLDGLGVFLIGSAVAALAPLIAVLGIGRFLQGFGGVGGADARADERRDHDGERHAGMPSSPSAASSR